MFASSGQVSARDPAEAQSTRKEEQAQAQRIAELSATDREVRAHEAAHLAAAQGLAVGGAQFGYVTGPDAKRYAVSGEVSIDASPGPTPEATLIKASQIRRAALAPVDPSAQDRAVAAAADQMAAQARIELRLQQADQNHENTPPPGSIIDTTA